MAHVLALDQGTTSSRALVFDGEGRLVARAQREFAQHFPQPGWVEHDPAEIWASQLAVAREALAAAGIGAAGLAAVGIANQRETTLLWDRASGEPLHRAIVWQDRRTAPECERLRAQGAEPVLRERTGLVADPYFSGTKIAWLLDSIPGARERAVRGELAFGTVDSWLVWKLTEGRLHVTDVTNASRTLLFDIRRNDWDDELLALLRVPRALMPRVVPSGGVVGECAPAILGAAVPIAGIAGDQQAALFGQACFDGGAAKNTYGTGCFALLHTGERPRRSASGLITTAACQLAPGLPGSGPRYALEGSVFVGGAVVQWLRDGLGIIRSSAEVEPLAASVPDAGGVVVVPAFAGLGAPWWDADARGAIFGLTRGTTAAHLARAAVESIAFQSADLLEAMRADAGEPLRELRVDGGAAANGALMQFQADLLGIPVVRPAMLEATAWGAASLAGLATGVWPDLDALSRRWKAERRFEPAMSRDEAQARMARWHDAVGRVR